MAGEILQAGRVRIAVQLFRISKMPGSLLPWKRNIFIDGGGNNGCSVRKFRKEFDRSGRFDIYTFEPNRIYEHDYDGIPRHTYIPAALHDKDGFQPFYLDREDGDGSTLFKNKLTRENGGFGILDTQSPVSVRTIDLSRWIALELPTRHHLVLKLDVEGAEYDILEKMLADGTVRHVRHLFIEWHWHKIGVPRQRHDRIVRALAEHGIPISEWDAQGY